jgi:hypothetical protein
MTQKDSPLLKRVDVAAFAFCVKLISVIDVAFETLVVYSTFLNIISSLIIVSCIGVNNLGELNFH